MPAISTRKLRDELRPQIQAKLRTWYGQPLAREASNAALRPSTADRATLVYRVLSDLLIRSFWKMDWHDLWQCCPRNPDRIEDLAGGYEEWLRLTQRRADQRASWIVDKHLPARWRDAARSVEDFQNQLHEVLGTRPYSPELLPALSAPGSMTEQSVTCRYSPMLRRDKVRKLILHEWERRCVPNRRDGRRDQRAFNDLLRAVTEDLADARLCRNVAHLNKHKGRSNSDDARRKLWVELCGAEQIKVRALVNTTWDRVSLEPGDCCLLPTRVFLRVAHEWALSETRDSDANRRRQAERPRWYSAPPAPLRRKPLYEPADKSPVSRKAQTVWRILEYLGDVRLGRGQSNASSTVSLNQVVQHLTGRKDGPRYGQIGAMVQTLAQLGFLSIAEKPVGNGKTAQRISILKYPTKKRRRLSQNIAPGDIDH